MNINDSKAREYSMIRKTHNTVMETNVLITPNNQQLSNKPVDESNDALNHSVSLHHEYFNIS